MAAAPTTLGIESAAAQDQRGQRLDAKAVVNGEVGGVGGDDGDARKHLREPDHGRVAKIGKGVMPGIRATRLAAR